MKGKLIIWRPFGLEQPARVVRDLEIMTYKEWANGLVMLNVEGPSERSHRVSEQKRIVEFTNPDEWGQRAREEG